MIMTFGDTSALESRSPARISQAADAPIEVRPCMDAPPDDVMEQMST